MIVALLLATTPQAAQASPNVPARHSLEGARVPYDDGAVEESLFLSSGGSIEGRLRTDLTGLTELERLPDAGQIAGLVTMLLPQEFEHEGRQLQMQNDGSLIVVAPPDVQARVRAAVEAIQGMLTAAAVLRIDVLELAPDAPSPLGGRSVVDAADAEALRSASVESYAVRLQAGRTAVVERRLRIPVLVDYDVEIAQGTAMFDPILGEAEAGMRLFLRGAPAGGGLALSVIALRGEPLQPEPLKVEFQARSLLGSESEGGAARYVDAPLALERLDLAFRSAAFDTFLPDGKALVIESSLLARGAGPDAAGARSRQVLVIQKTGGGLVGFQRFQPQGARRELLFVNAEMVGLPALNTWGYPGSIEDESLQRVPLCFARLATGHDLFLTDWAAARFTGWRAIGPWLGCVFDPSRDEDAAARLEALVGGWPAETGLVELELRARSAGEEIASFRLPVRVGSRLAVMAGVTTTELSDYDVEVAQFAGTPDPVVRPVFEGLAALARVERSSSATAADVSCTVSARRGRSQWIALESPMMGSIERSVLDVLRASERVELAAGAGEARAVLGEGGPGLALEVRLR